MIYSDDDYDNANNCVDLMKRAGVTFGVKIDEPGDSDYYQVPTTLAKKGGSGFVERLRAKDVLPLNKYKIAIVILTRPESKKLIKAFLDS